MIERILGIDPGLARVGWGVIDVSGPPRLLEAGAILTTRATAHSERLRAIYDELRAVIVRHEPKIIAVEEIFQGKSMKSALLAGEGRGVCILAAAHADLRVIEYPATTIKLAITGNGRASKPQVQGMVRRLLGLASDPTPHDAADAIAVAVTHSQRARGIGELRLSR